MTVSLEDILRKSFSKGIRNLILGSYWEDLDKPVPYVFAKVMVTYVDVLGPRAKLWKPCEFQRTGVVFKKLCSIRRAWYRSLENPSRKFPEPET
jgi:hypothetical protein